MNYSSQNDLVRTTLEQLATERWARQNLRSLLRACWLSACVWCIGLGGALVWGWPLRLNVLAILTLGIIGASIILLLRPRLSPQEVARRLDRRYHLDEQLATAVELARTNPGEASDVAARLFEQSGVTVQTVRRRISRQQAAPWSEVIALVSLLVVGGGLATMLGISPFSGTIGSTLDPLPPLAVPQDVQATPEPFAQPEGGPQAPGDTGQPQPGPGDPQVLAPIADALRDQGATRPAADALDQGDVAAAADALRELADQAGQLSQASREQLAENLRDAASQIEERNPGLADQLRQSADGLEQGGSDASQALEDLASALEQNTQSPPLGAGGQGNQPTQGDQQTQGEGSGQGDQQGEGSGQGGGGGGAGNGEGGESRQSPPSDRLGVDGQPLELQAEGDSTQATGSDQQPEAGAEVVPGSVSGGGSGGQQNAIGTDPLRVPTDERDVVQDYFTP